MEIQDLAAEYESRSNEELLRLSLDQEQLTSAAVIALNNELAKRGINGAEQLDAFRETEEERTAKVASNPGSFFFIQPWGVGRRRFGKAERVYNSANGVERFKTTVFVVLFWVPLIPTGTYVVERSLKSLFPRIIFREKLPLDWEQVLKVWIVAALCVFAVIVAYGLLIRGPLMLAPRRNRPVGQSHTPIFDPHNPR